MDVTIWGADRITLKDMQDLQQVLDEQGVPEGRVLHLRRYAFKDYVLFSEWNAKTTCGFTVKCEGF